MEWARIRDQAENFFPGLKELLSMEQHYAGALFRIQSCSPQVITIGTHLPGSVLGVRSPG